MTIITKYYHKIKYLLIEYKTTLELDNTYMMQYLSSYGNELNNSLINTYNNNILENDILENDILEINKTIQNNTIKMLYKNLARKYHPDKNNNKSDEFITISKAYETNDFLTLFIYSYECNFYDNKKINEDLIDVIEQEIKKKEEEINSIKNKIHWQWVSSNNDLEKELIHNYIKTQFN
jgi:isocitrate dehydrogenase kinase/phosphatase